MHTLEFERKDKYSTVRWQRYHPGDVMGCHENDIGFVTITAYMRPLGPSVVTCMEQQALHIKSLGTIGGLSARLPVWNLSASVTIMERQ